MSSVLVIKKSSENYRLRSYWDFERIFPSIHEKVYFAHTDHAAKRHESTTLGESSPLDNKDIYDIIKETSVEEPDVIFIWDARFRSSDLTKLKSKVYLVLTDSVLKKEDARLMEFTNRSHKVNFSGVFHNYLFNLDYMKSLFPSGTPFFHWPCWGAEEFDYANFNGVKNIDFFLSGAVVPEYQYRGIFNRMLQNDCLTHKVVNTFGEGWTEGITTNQDYYNNLLSSKFSPHDGGVFGRMVPRYFESGLARSIVISPDLGEEMKRNGFVNEENCILFRRGNDPSYIFNTIEKFDQEKLSLNCYNLVKERHTTSSRIRQFLETVL